MGKKGGKHLKITVLFICIQALLLALMGGGRELGVSTVNVDVLYFLWTLIFFVLLGYGLASIRFGIGFRRRKRRLNILSGILWIIALGIAIHLLLNPRGGVWKPSGERGSPEIGTLKEVLDGIRAVYQPLPGYLYTISLLVLVIIPVVLRLRKRMGKGRGIPEKSRFEPNLSYELIEGTPEERVIKMYKNVVAGLVLKGYPYRESWTHREHERKLIDVFPDTKDLDTLTLIFEKAKYAKKLTPGDIKAARDSYERLMEWLR